MVSKIRGVSLWLLVLTVLVMACGAPPANTTARDSSPGSPTASSAATATPATPRPPDSSTRLRAEVISVTDGDTIRVRINGQSVPLRYIGIDTPETVDPRKSVQCFGREASAFNALLVAGKVVELEKDVSETDKYDRLLRYVWIDGKMANEELVRGGYAKSSSYPPDVKYQDRFRALEAAARAAKVGLWSDAACAVATVAPTTAPTVAAPTATAPSAALTVTITSSIYGTVAATTLAGASCTAQARLPSGSMSDAAGLKTTPLADTSGAVRWSYATRSNTTKGTGTHTVTCSFAGQTRSTSAAFVVQ